MDTPQPPFEIKDLEFNLSSLNDVGADLVYLHFDIYSPAFKDPEFIYVKVGMHDIVTYIAEKDEEIVKHISEIRSGMKGYGPMESKVLEQLLKEGFDFMPWLIRWTQDCLPLMSEHQRQIDIQSPEMQAKRLEILAKLEPYVKAMKRESVKREAMNEAFLKLLMEEFYVLNPEMKEADLAVRDNLEDIIHNYVHRMTDELLDRIHQAEKQAEKE